MNAEAGFAALLLQRSAVGYGGAAASQLLERVPALRAQGGAMAEWKAHLTQRAVELAAALSAAESRLFTERVLWSRKTFAARNQDDQLIALSLSCLREILAESLPENGRRVAVDYLDQALAALDGAAADIGPSELDPANDNDRLALRFLEAALEGNSAEAIAGLKQAVAEGLDVREVYTSVLLPAQREIGRLWHADEVSVAEEHLVSATTRQAMAVLLHSAERQPANGATLVAACVPGNIHDIGLLALTDLLQLAGWRTIYLGADVPIKDLPATVDFFQADLVLLGSTLSTQIEPAKKAIAALREQCTRPVKIMVGGAAFDEVPDLWQTLGADAYAPDATSALHIADDFLRRE
jgi:methanogenic corrinoid protein MtbC1